MLAGLVAGALCGLVNGVLIAYVGLSPFVVTLGMLSIARSFAVVLSQNKMIYKFGPDGRHLQGDRRRRDRSASPTRSGCCWSLTLIFGLRASASRAGAAISTRSAATSTAARLTGVPVDRVKVQVYVVSRLTAAIAAILSVGWQGSAINALGTGYELRVIASTVIGGANLMGGEGGAYGAFIGAALIEVIRNSLLMAGVDSNWQGTFVGCSSFSRFCFEQIRGRARD